MLGALLVQRGHGAEVVVRTAVTFNVDSHAFKHFKNMTISVNFENLSFVFLVEAGYRQEITLVRRETKIGVGIGFNEQGKVVSFVKLVEASLKVFKIPLVVSSSLHLASSLVQELVAAADVNHAVRVDVLLELRL